MLKVNEELNLTAIRDTDGVILKHIVDSCAIVPLLPEGARIVDIGCGGGFPTFPISILRDDVSVLGVDSVTKKVEYVKNTESSVIAKDIYDFFPELSLNDLTAIIERYKTSDAWAKNSEITEKDFEHLQEIMISANELDKKAPYDKLVYQGK